MNAIINYLKNEVLPEDQYEAKVIKRKAYSYAFDVDVLYRSSNEGATLQCLTKKEAALILEELHFGICRRHCGR